MAPTQPLMPGDEGVAARVDDSRRISHRLRGPLQIVDGSPRRPVPVARLVAVPALRSVRSLPGENGVAARCDGQMRSGVGDRECRPRGLQARREIEPGEDEAVRLRPRAEERSILRLRRSGQPADRHRSRPCGNGIPAPRHEIGLRHHALGRPDGNRAPHVVGGEDRRPYPVGRRVRRRLADHLGRRRTAGGRVANRPGGTSEGSGAVVLPPQAERQSVTPANVYAPG